MAKRNEFHNIAYPSTLPEKVLFMGHKIDVIIFSKEKILKQKEGKKDATGNNSTKLKE